MVYCYAKLGGTDFGLFRLAGPGLGNMLFPWARMVIYSADNNCSKLYPAWPQLKIGPLFRGELDSRFYYGLFDKNSEYIAGWQKYAILAITKKYSEYSIDRERESGVIVFDGLGEYFTPLFGRSALINAELAKITSSERTRHIFNKKIDAIGIHIRCSDFAPADENRLRNGESNIRLPMHWYISIIQALNSAAGVRLNYSVYSDGRDDEISDILRLEGVQRGSSDGALSDMISLSRHKVLITSGSTYSMWASFLGQVPTIWFPGQLKWRLLDNAANEVMVDYMQEIPRHFTELVV